VNVICPKCKTENHLPDPINRHITYKCEVCENEFDRISNTNFRRVALVMLIAWWLVPGLVWASRPIILSADEYTLQATIGTFMFCWALFFLPPPVLLTTVLFLGKGFRLRKPTGVSPKGFRCFVCTSVLGFCGCATGLALYVHSL